MPRHEHAETGQHKLNNVNLEGGVRISGDYTSYHTSSITLFIELETL